MPGHFPGAPVVPGVLLLAESLQRLAPQCGGELACRRVERAKFLLPVVPGVAIDATLALDGQGRGNLELRVAATLVAQATLAFLTPADGPARD